VGTMWLGKLLGECNGPVRTMKGIIRSRYVWYRCKQVGNGKRHTKVQRPSPNKKTRLKSYARKRDRKTGIKKTNVLERRPGTQGGVRAVGPNFSNVLRNHWPRNEEMAA